MKIMDKILSFLGFDIDEDEKLNKEVKTAKNSDKNLPSSNQEKVKRKKDFFILYDDPLENEFIDLKPKNFTEIQNAMNFLKDGKKLKINLSQFEDELIRALDFMTGFCCCLNAEIEKLDETTYKLFLK